MDVIMINEDTDQKSMHSTSTIDLAITSGAIDISLLTSFEEEHVDGEPDLVVELINIYLDDVPHKLKAMREALELGDATSLRGVAHNLKGSSSSLGARQMAALCNGLEVGANELATRGGSEFLNRVEQAFDRVRLAFTAERHRRTTCVLVPDVGSKEF